MVWRERLSLQSLWDSWSCVLRPPSGVPRYTPLREKRSAILQRLYGVDHLEGFGLEEEESSNDEPDAEVVGGDAIDEAFVATTESHEDVQKTILLRQWFGAALRPHMFVSVSLPGDDGADRLRMMQILSVGGKGIFVEAVGSKTTNRENGRLILSVQNLEVAAAFWRWPTIGVRTAWQIAQETGSNNSAGSSGNIKVSSTEIDHASAARGDA